MITLISRKVLQSRAVLGVVGLTMLIGVVAVALIRAAGPLAAFEAEAGTLANDAAAQVVTGASGGSVVQFSMGTAVNPTPTPPGTPVPTTYPAAGSVGYRGDVSALTTITSAAAAPTGSYFDTQYGYLQVNANDFTLDHVYIKGCLDFYGSGTLTVTNSIIEGGYGTWCGVNSRADGAVVKMSDTTVRWKASSAPDVGNGAGGIKAMGDTVFQLARNDISGFADGIHVAGQNNIIEYNYIHDLALTGTTGATASHNDGLQVFYAPNLTLRYNRIDLNGFDGLHQNAALFFQGTDFTAPQMFGNFFGGGGYVVRMDANVKNATFSNNTFANLAAGQFGYIDIISGATFANWANNKSVSGQAINYP
jgi:hypothetical protein